MCLFCQSVHCLCHAVKEERLGLLLAPMAIGSSNQLLCLGHSKRSEQVWDRLDCSERRSQT